MLNNGVDSVIPFVSCRHNSLPNPPTITAPPHPTDPPSLSLTHTHLRKKSVNYLNSGSKFHFPPCCRAFLLAGFPRSPENLRHLLSKRSFLKGRVAVCGSRDETIYPPRDYTTTKYSLHLSLSVFLSPSGLYLSFCLSHVLFGSFSLTLLHFLSLALYTSHSLFLLLHLSYFHFYYLALSLSLTSLSRFYSCSLFFSRSLLPFVALVLFFPLGLPNFFSHLSLSFSLLFSFACSFRHSRCVFFLSLSLPLFTPHSPFFYLTPSVFSLTFVPSLLFSHSHFFSVFLFQSLSLCLFYSLVRSMLITLLVVSLQEAHSCLSLKAELQLSVGEIAEASGQANCRQ